MYRDLHVKYKKQKVTIPISFAGKIKEKINKTQKNIAITIIKIKKWGRSYTTAAYRLLPTNQIGKTPNVLV